MAKIFDWDSHIGGRVRLRDLHILLTVVQCGSMAKAAEQLGVSQPAVSETISDLEHALGVRLLDRSSRGVEPTESGRALLKSGKAAFDELRQAIRDIENLADPGAGDVHIGASEPLMAGFIPAIIARLACEHPRMVFHIVQGTGHSLRATLRERKVDLIISRRRPNADDDLVSEELFDEQLFLVAGLQNQWSRRRKIDLSELLDQPWIVPPPDTLVGAQIAKDMKSSGLPLPKSSVVSESMPLRNMLLATGRYVTVLPGSMLRFGDEQLKVKILPVRLPGKGQAIELITLKNRYLSPVVERFIACAREVARPMRTGAAPGYARDAPRKTPSRSRKMPPSQTA
jgi:DNA-binding transcriptional LysR family regulator